METLLPNMLAAGGGNFPATLALLGVVLLVAALLSGVIERSGAPQVAVFLALGAVLGPFGVQVLEIGLDSEALRIVATLALALILFTEALTLNLQEVRKHIWLTFLILVPGTILAAILVSTTAHFAIGLAWPLALMLGAALASTDPVLLRALLRWKGLPKDTRLALRLEAGLNDIVLLPIIFIAMALAMAKAGDAPIGQQIGSTMLRVGLISPFVGVFVGLVAVSTLAMVRKRIGVRRDYESMYSLGVCFVSFGAAEFLQGSGFVAAFFAGATIAVMDLEMCDCFLEYGETTAELATLFTFVLLGVGLVWSGLSVPSWGVALTVLVAFLARPLALQLALKFSHMEKRPRRLLSFFGPRGLSSILLVLIPVFSGIPGSEQIFTICCTVMLISVVLHGGAVMVVGRENAPVAETRARVKADTGEDVPLPYKEADPVNTITADEVMLKRASGAKMVLLDVRSERAYADAELDLRDSYRVDLHRTVDSFRNLGIPEGTTLLAYCTCPAEQTSLRVVDELRAAGHTDAYAVVGGYDALVARGWPTITHLPMAASPA